MNAINAAEQEILRLQKVVAEQSNRELALIAQIEFCQGQIAEQAAEIERLQIALQVRVTDCCREVKRGMSERIAILEAENQLLKSNLENSNENWRLVLEENDRLIAIIKEADLNVAWIKDEKP